MTTYTNIPKPTSTSYTSLNFQGKQIFDDANLTYDDASAYYDTVNMNQYTSHSKPSSTSYTKITKPI